MTVLTLTTGSVLVMWLGEQITERGIGNGMSLLIYAGIVVGLPRGGARRRSSSCRPARSGLLQLVLLLVADGARSSARSSSSSAATGG